MTRVRLTVSVTRQVFTNRNAGNVEVGNPLWAFVRSNATVDIIGLTIKLSRRSPCIRISRSPNQARSDSKCVPLKATTIQFELASQNSAQYAELIEVSSDTGSNSISIRRVNCWMRFTLGERLSTWWISVCPPWPNTSRIRSPGPGKSLSSASPGRWGLRRMCCRTRESLIAPRVVELVRSYIMLARRSLDRGDIRE